MEKLQRICINIVLVILAGFVGYSAFQAVFILPGGNLWKAGGTKVGALCISVVILGVAIIYILYKVLQRLSEKNVKIAMYCIMGVILVGQIVWLIIVLKNKAFPSTDLATNTEEAFRLLSNGKFLLNSSTAIYPTNRTHIILLYFFYKCLSTMGITAYWQASVILALVCIDISIVFTVLIAKKLLGMHQACLFMVLCAVNPITYLCLPYYYTSIMGMPFFMAATYFAILLLEETTLERYILYAILTGVLSVFGFFVRGTGLFALIALVVYAFFIVGKENVKSISAKLALSVVSAIIVANVWGAVQVHYDEYDRTDSAPSITHTIMMSLQGEGGYVQSDLDYTLSFPTKEEKEAANIAVIKQRIEKLGVAGLLELAGRKTQFTWSHGHARYTNWYPTTYSYIAGEKKDFLVLYCQAYRIILWLFILVNAVYCIKRRERTSSLLLFIMLFGAFVLHVFIESNPQYSIPFMFLMMLLATEGLGKYFEQKKRLNEEKGFQEKIFVLNIIGAFILVCTSIEYYPTFVLAQRECADVTVAQGYHNTAQTLVEKNDEIVQSFRTAEEFDTVELYVTVLDAEFEEKKYSFILKNEKNEVLHETDFGIQDLDGNRIKIILPETVVTDDNAEYTIQIIDKGTEEADSLKFKCENRTLDYYDDGEMRVNGVVYSNYDLAFTVSKSVQRAYWEKNSYVIVWTILICCNIIVSILLFRTSKKTREVQDYQIKR